MSLSPATGNQSELRPHMPKWMLAYAGKSEGFYRGIPQTKQTYHNPSYPVIWRILGLFSSPISREIDHP